MRFAALLLCCAAVLATLDEFAARDVLGAARESSAIIVAPGAGCVTGRGSAGAEPPSLLRNITQCFHIFSRFGERKLIQSMYPPNRIRKLPTISTEKRAPV